MGHSMGGAALMFAIRNPKFYLSTSIIAPRCNISNPGSTLAVEAMKEYFGENKDEAKKYDFTELIKNLPK